MIRKIWKTLLKVRKLPARLPIRIRISVGYAIWMLVVFLAIGIGLYKFIEARFYDSVDVALQTIALSYQKNLQMDKKRSQKLAMDALIRDFLYGQAIPPSKYYGQVIDLSSGRVYRSTSNNGEGQPRLPVNINALHNAKKGLSTFENIQDWPEPGETYRQLTMPVKYRGRLTGELIQIGALLNPVVDSLKNIKLILLIALSLGLGLSVMFGYFISNSIIRPVKQITQAAAKLNSDELDTRLSLPGSKDELRELVLTFNAMLDRLGEAFSRLKRFTGDVSHELRTPVSVLKAEAELALRKTRDPAYYEESLRNISREANYMTEVINDLLLLARAESHSVAMNWEVVNLKAFIEEIKISLKPLLENRDIQLHVDRPHELREINACKGYLILAVNNLISNSIKHSVSGGRIDLSFHIDNAQLVVKVKDHGGGIAEKDLPYVFEAFYRADSARNRKEGGVGIGLSLTSALVKLHGGEISVESKLHVGTEVTIRIPQNNLVSDNLA